MISTRSLLIRTRFFFSLEPCACAIFSSRSLRRSSLLFFFGRVLWLSCERSILPNTFGSLALRRCSLFKVKTLSCLASVFSSSLSSGNASLGCSATGATTAGSCRGASSFFTSATSAVLAGSSACTCWGAGVSSTFFSSTSTGTSSLISFSFLSGAAGAGLGFLPRLSRSILPRGLNCCTPTLLFSAGRSTFSTGRFFSFGFFMKSLPALFLTSASCL